MLTGKTILIVDDEDGIREIVILELEMHGCRVLQASGGQEALGILQRERIDAVLTDVRMPGGNGLDLLDHARALKPAPEVFLMTGYSDISAEDAKARGAAGTFQKPFALQHVVETIRARLGA